MKLIECKRCHLHKYREKVVVGVGPRKKHWIVGFGEAPGKNENLEGKPFVGASGKKQLDKWFNYLPIERSAIFIDNIVHCRPCNSASSPNREPLDYEIERCSVWFRRTLTSLKPKIIITFGKTPLKVFLSCSKISDHIGNVYFTEKWDAYIFPLFHPAALIYPDKTGKRVSLNKNALGKLSLALERFLDHKKPVLDSQITKVI